MAPRQLQLSSSYGTGAGTGTRTQTHTATVSLIVHATQDSGNDNAVHTLKASHVTQVFDHVDRTLNLAPASYELLCGGLLLRRDPLAKLPAAYPGANVRVELIRYQDPSVLASSSSSSPSTPTSDVDHDEFARFIDSSSPTNDDENENENDADDQLAQDECAQFTAAHADPSSLTDKEHILLMLVEMFEDLPTDILVHATLTSDALDDAVEAALTLQVLAAADAEVQSATSGSATTSSTPSSVDADVFAKYLAEPPAAPPFSPAPSTSGKRKKKKKTSSAAAANALGPPGVSALTSPEMRMLLDMFPKHHASQLDMALLLHNNNVDSAAAYLLGVPAHKAFKCDGGCGELGFPCLVHGTAWRSDVGGDDAVKTWSVPEEQQADDGVKVLMEVFADHAMWEVKKALASVGGDIEQASRVLAGDEIEAERSVKSAAAAAAAVESRPSGQAKPRPRPSSPLPKPATAHDNPFSLLLDSKRAAAAASAAASFTRVTHKRKQPHLPPAFKPSKRDHRTPAAQAADHLVLPSLPNPSYPVAVSTDDLYVQRAHRFAMARAALSRHARLGGQVAGALADAGHELTCTIRAREHAVAWAHVDAQLQSHRAKWVVDLHGLTVEQAKSVVPEVVRRWWVSECVRDDGLDVRARRVLTLVVGVGNHSKAGQARLGPAVVKAVRGMGGRVVDESKARGQVVVVGLAEGAVVR